MRGAGYNGLPHQLGALLLARCLVHDPAARATAAEALEVRRATREDAFGIIMS